MPIITLEVMPDSSISENVPYDNFFQDNQTNIEEDVKDPTAMPFLEDTQTDRHIQTGIHFLVNKTEEENVQSMEQDNSHFNVRSDLMEYTTRSDGSVTCKVCGKVLASRSHWYRHKFRAHVMNSADPAPLFQCQQCRIYFKSRKGYIGHLASQHSETLQDASPVLTNAQAEALAKETSIIQYNPTQEQIQINAVEVEFAQSNSMEADVKKEPDPELSIPKTIVPTITTVPILPSFENMVVDETPTRNIEPLRRNNRRQVASHIDAIETTNEDKEREWQEKRSREEKLVADIIARVRRECEAQGSGGPARRGYSRKSLHT